MVASARPTTAATESPLVSVIVPAWNAAEVLGEALESVRCQTYQQLEVLVVDDGSTDGTAEVARRFCAPDSRFHLIRQENLGVSAARNAGIRQAHGEWIAFLDADDVWLPEKLNRQLALAREEPRANFLFTNFFVWDGRRDLYLEFPDQRTLPEGNVSRGLIFDVYHGCPASMSTGMVRREALEAAGLFDPELALAEDWDLWLRVSERGLWVRGTREPLARYRRWNGNLTNQKLRLAEAVVHVLEKNLRATQRPELRPLYRRSLAAARARLEFARARSGLETHPEVAPGAVWRAWQLNPRRLKWLMWFGLLVWPKFLGGRATAAIVHRKIISKW